MSADVIATEEKKPSLLASTLAVIALILVLVIVIWGLVHLAELAAPWFSNTSKPTLVVHSPSSVTANEAFTLSWDYAAAHGGSYALLYQCQGDLRFETTLESGVTSIPCGAAVGIPEGGNSLTLTPRLSGEKVTEALTVLYFPVQSATASAQGSTSLTINPGATSIPATSTPEKPVQTGSGPADLSVQLVSASVDQYGNGIVTFDIGNIGGATSGTYYFTAQLPTATGYAYNSTAQTPLAPGAHILNTLRFDQAVNGLVSVALKSGDKNLSNDYTSIWLNPTYGTPPYTTY